MKAFVYIAYTDKGRRKSGSVIAESERDATRQLKEQGMFVAELQARNTRPRGDTQPGQGLNLRRRHRLTADLQAVFTRQMAVLLGAGLTSEFALDAVRSGGGGASMEALAIGAKAALLDGQPLSRALADSGAGFPPYYIASVQAGETSGDTAEVFLKLADHLEAVGADKAQISTALLYPMFVAAVSLLVCVILMTTVAPEIVMMFEGSGRSLPQLTVMMLAISGWMSAHWPWLLGGGLVAILGYFLAMRIPRLRHLRDGILLRLPVVGGLIRQGAAVQYLRTLALVLASRHPILSGADSAAGVLVIDRFHREAAQVTTAIGAGSRLSDAVQDLSIIPPVVCQLMSVGEQSSNLAHMVERSAVLVENNLRNDRKRIAALLEPLLMMLVGGGVLVIVLSVLLPIFDLQFIVTG